MGKTVQTSIRTPGAAVELPPPRLAGNKSIEECLKRRRSCRMFADEPVTLEQVSQLLWAAQGVTGLGGLRAAPSAGAVYAIHTYLIAMNATGLRPGAYAYDPDRHVVSLWKAGAMRAKLKRAAIDQEEVENAAAAIVLAADYGRARREFGDAGTRLVHIEAGHIAENVCLQATALSLGVITFGKTDPVEIKRIVDLPEPEEHTYLILAGPRL
jgi:SagB-type dehydrogenase family enzyme